MRITCAIAMLIVVAGCQRSGTIPPPTVAAAPTAAISANASLPAALPAVKPASRKKPGSSVLGSVLAKTDRTGSGVANRGSGARDIDPCVGLADAAWDDCVARNETTNTSDGNDDPSLDRPELDPRDRQLISSEDAAAGDHDLDAQDDPMQDQALEEELPPEDNPPDEGYDPPPSDDVYNH